MLCMILWNLHVWIFRYMKNRIRYLKYIEKIDVGGDLIGGRRDVDGAAGRVVGAADPVLDAAQTTDLLIFYIER